MDVWTFGPGLMVRWYIWIWPGRHGCTTRKYSSVVWSPLCKLKLCYQCRYCDEHSTQEQNPLLSQIHKMTHTDYFTIIDSWTILNITSPLIFWAGSSLALWSSWRHALGCASEECVPPCQDFGILVYNGSINMTKMTYFYFNYINLVIFIMLHFVT